MLDVKIGFHSGSCLGRSVRFRVPLMRDFEAIALDKLSRCSQARRLYDGHEGKRRSTRPRLIIYLYISTLGAPISNEHCHINVYSLSAPWSREEGLVLMRGSPYVEKDNRGWVAGFLWSRWAERPSLSCFRIKRI